MIPIIKWEIARRKFYLLWWCVGMAALVIILLLIYPSIHHQAVQLNHVLKQLPQSVRDLRGGESDLTTPAGYLNAELFYITLPLLLIIMAVGLGGSLLSKDEQDHTLELLLARPVSRSGVLAGKAISGILLICIAGAVATLTAVILARVAGMDIGSRYVLLAGICTTVFATMFGAIAYALSAASIVSRRLGVAIAVIASFGGYLLQSLSSVSDYIKTPAQWLPYHYFMPQDMLKGTVDRGFVYYMLGIFAACAVTAYLGFRHRDIS